jgi:predicted metal-binding protein
MICTTCDRYRSTHPCANSIGERLADAVERAIEPLVATGALRLRRVPCLSGCAQPANWAIGSSQRVKMRLHGLNESHAGSIAELVGAWLATSTGVVTARDVLPAWRHREARTITAREVIEPLDEIVSREPA